MSLLFIPVPFRPISRRHCIEKCAVGESCLATHLKAFKVHWDTNKPWSYFQYIYKLTVIAISRQLIVLGYLHQAWNWYMCILQFVLSLPLISGCWGIFYSLTGCNEKEMCDDLMIWRSVYSSILSKTRKLNKYCRIKIILLNHAPFNYNDTWDAAAVARSNSITYRGWGKTSLLHIFVVI